MPAPLPLLGVAQRAARLAFKSLPRLALAQLPYLLLATLVLMLPLDAIWREGLDQMVLRAAAVGVAVLLALAAGAHASSRQTSGTSLLSFARRLPDVLGVACVLALPLVAAMLLIVVLDALLPGLAESVGFAFVGAGAVISIAALPALPAAALEPLGVAESFRRGWMLATGNHWRIALLVICFAILTQVVEGLISALAGLAMLGGLDESVLLPLFGSVLLAGIVAIAAFGGALLHAIHETLVSAQAPPGPPAPPVDPMPMA